MKKKLLILSALVALFGHPAHSAQDFKFANFSSLAEMQSFLQGNFSSVSDKEMVRETFVNSGGATLVQHPLRPNTEKYIYDINLCHYYIWRWNISADYDDSGKLKDIYLNGMGDERTASMKAVSPSGKKASISKVQRPRPEAHKGESSLGYILFDADNDFKTIDDQMLVGAGPSRPDPLNMGKMVAYKSVDPWRSIFDQDDAKFIAAYDGDCSAVDKAVEEKRKKLKASQKTP
tara:strand:+ start:77 stop:775 length:699 start_codon:yes stop_codon:yes gene_type:complete